MSATIMLNSQTGFKTDSLPNGLENEQSKTEMGEMRLSRLECDKSNRAAGQSGMHRKDPNGIGINPFIGSQLFRSLYNKEIMTYMYGSNDTK